MQKTRAVNLLLGFVFFGVIFLEQSHAKSVLAPGFAKFHESFEALALSQDFWRYELPSPQRITFDESVFSHGRKAVKLTIGPNDRINSGERSEISLKDSDPLHSESWYQWMFYIPEAWEDTPKAEWVLLGQWHDQPEAGQSWGSYPAHNPMIGVYYGKGSESTYGIKIQYGIHDNKTYITDHLPLEKGKWHKIKFHIYWSRGGDGYIQTWLDDKKVSKSNRGGRFYGANMYNNAPAFLKLGIYRDSAVSTTNSIFIDDLRRVQKIKP